MTSTVVCAHLTKSDGCKVGNHGEFSRQAMLPSLRLHTRSPIEITQPMYSPLSSEYMCIRRLGIDDRLTESDGRKVCPHVEVLLGFVAASDIRVQRVGTNTPLIAETL